MPAEDVSVARYGLVNARLAIALAVLPFPLALFLAIFGVPAAVATIVQVVSADSRLVFPGLAQLNNVVDESTHDGNRLFSFLAAVSIWCLIASLPAAAWSHFRNRRAPGRAQRGIRVLMNGGQYRRPVFWAVLAGGWLYALYSIFWSGSFFIEAHKFCTQYATSFASSGHSKDCISWNFSSLTDALWTLGWRASLANFMLILGTSIAWHELTSDSPGA